MGVESQGDKNLHKGFFLPIQHKLPCGRRRPKMGFYLYCKKWLVGVENSPVFIKCLDFFLLISPKVPPGRRKINMAALLLFYFISQTIIFVCNSVNFLRFV